MVSIEYLIYSELYKSKDENKEKIKSLEEDVSLLLLEVMTLKREVRELKK